MYFLNDLTTFSRSIGSKDKNKRKKKAKAGGGRTNYDNLKETRHWVNTGRSISQEVKGWLKFLARQQKQNK